MFPVSKAYVVYVNLIKFGKYMLNMAFLDFKQ